MCFLSHRTQGMAFYGKRTGYEDSFLFQRNGVLEGEDE